MNAKISVVVPVYKIEESLLRRCLQSLCDQTYEMVEFIVVDDGSPDKCGEICDSYAAKESRMRVIHTENMGVSNARNVGIKNSSGEYIIFVDGDDFVENDLCEKCVTAMNGIDVDMLFFMHMTTKNPTLAIAETGEITKLSEEQIERIRYSVIEQSEPFEGYWVGPPWGKVFKKSIIVDNELQFVLGLRKSQDRVFVLDYMLKVKSAGLYSYCGYHYVSNDQSICHRYNRNIVSILEKAQFEFTKRVIAERPYDPVYKQALNTMNLIFLSEYVTLNYLNSDNNERLKTRYYDIRNLLRKDEYIKALKYGKMDSIGRKKRLILFLLKHRLIYSALLLRWIL